MDKIFVIGIALLTLLSCFHATPRSHEEWGAECIGKQKVEDFQKCLDDWGQWELEAQKID